LSHDFILLTLVPYSGLDQFTFYCFSVIVYTAKHFHMNFSLHWQDIVWYVLISLYTVQGSLARGKLVNFLSYTRASKTCQGKSGEESLFVCSVGTLRFKKWPETILRWNNYIYLLTGQDIWLCLISTYIHTLMPHWHYAV
jgi:hypothetical protein